MEAQQTASLSRQNRAGGWLAGWLLLLLATAAIYRPAVTGDGAFEAWDQARVYVPLQVSNARQRSAGEIPLWFRHGFLGYPLQGENECSGVYPPAAVFHLIGDPGTAWAVFLLLHHLLAAGGTMLLLKGLGSGPTGATLGAVVMVFGGWFVGEIPQATLVTSFAWTPLVSALWLRACRTRRLAPAAWAGLALAIQASGAHPQVLFYTLLALSLGVVCEASGARKWQRASWAAAAATVTVGIGLGLAAPQLWYCLETLLTTERGAGLSFDRQMDGSLPPHFLLQLLLPGATGDDHRLQILFTDIRIYAGILTLPLALVGWRKGPTGARIFRWGLVLSVLLALGRYGGLFLVLGELPGFRSIHVPARFLMFTSLSIAVLAGLGLDHLIGEPADTVSRTWKRSAVALGVTGVVLLTAGLVSRFSPGSLDPNWLFGRGNHDEVFVREWQNVSETARNAALSWAAILGGSSALLGGALCLVAPTTDSRRVGMLCVVLVTVDLGLAATRLLNFAPGDFYRTRPVTLDLVNRDRGRVAATVPDYAYDAHARTLALLPDNSAGLFDVEAFSINPGARSDWLRRTSAAVSPKLHALFHVGTLIIRRELPAVSDPIPGIRRSDELGEYGIYNVPDVQPRASLCRDILLVTRPQAVLDTIASPRFVLGETVILDRPPHHLPGTANESDVEESVRIVTDRAQTVEIEASLVRDGILVLADLFHDGWRATDNGQPVTILRANGLCRGIALGPGLHRIRFEYRPRSFEQGLWVSAATLIVLLVCSFVSWRRGRG